jgi:predicted RNA-binding Zn-ribbon protein involved in translation (DUF1610 family)
MFEIEGLGLLHPHDGQGIPMEEVRERDAASDDPERTWAAGERIYRCPRCDEEVVVRSQAERENVIPG